MSILTLERRAELREDAKKRQNNIVCTVTCLVYSDELLALLDAADEADRLVEAIQHAQMCACLCGECVRRFNALAEGES